MLAERGDGASELPLPETVQGIIAARLDALPPEREAAAPGRRRHRQGVLARRARRARRARAGATSRSCCTRSSARSSCAASGARPSASESEYAFRHLLVRDVAYGADPARGRGEKHHERAAAWIESLGRLEDHAEMLAHHYLEALELVERAAGQEEPTSSSTRRALGARDAGDRARRAQRVPGRGAVLRGGARALAAGRRASDPSCSSPTRGAASTTPLSTRAVLDGGDRDGLPPARRRSRRRPRPRRMARRRLAEPRRPRPRRSSISSAPVELRRRARGPRLRRRSCSQELARVLMMAEDLERVDRASARESLELAEELGLERRACPQPRYARRLRGSSPGDRRRPRGSRARRCAIGAAVQLARGGSALANLDLDVRPAWRTGKGMARCTSARRSLAKRLGSGRLHPLAGGRARHPLLLGGPLGRGAGDGGQVHPRDRGGLEPLHGGHLPSSPRRDLARAGSDPRPRWRTRMRATELSRAAKDPQIAQPVAGVRGSCAHWPLGDRGGANALADELRRGVALRSASVSRTSRADARLGLQATSPAADELRRGARPGAGHDAVARGGATRDLGRSRGSGGRLRRDRLGAGRGLRAAAAAGDARSRRRPGRGRPAAEARAPRVRASWTAAEAASASA